MKVVIIGNGVAGTFTAQHIRDQDKDTDIEIYSAEKYLYYTRIKLPELISEKIIIEDMIVYKQDWYERNNIKVFLKQKVNKILPKDKKILIEGIENPIAYDKLVIATGSVPNMLPIKNAREMIGKGVFSLRSIDDALEIKNFIKENNVKKAVIIGGGLLGLELAKQIKDCNLETTIVEFFPRLLPRQLDLDCGGFLKEEIERIGILVELNAATEEIMEDGSVRGVRIKDGRNIRAEIILIQAGIIPKIDLAKDANLETNRGIIVNQYLETSEPDIYAVGDCVEYKNQIWGIIPAALEQSKILAGVIKGKKDLEYKGTVPKNTLKIVGIDLTSIGIYDPEDVDFVGAGWKILRNMNKKGKCYKKIVLKENVLKGAILFGEKKAISFLNKNLESEVDEKELREAIALYKWICGDCGEVYDEALMDLLFKDLPVEWKCTKCKASKDKYRKEI